MPWLLRALHRLDLTDPQRQGVREILAAARRQSGAERSAVPAPDFVALSNPGDPNFGNALKSLQARVATRIERQGRTEQQIYDLLTPQQQARLPEILADMQARRAARMHASS